MASFLKSKQIWLLAIFGSLMLSPIIILSELWGTQYLILKYKFNKDVGAFLSSLTFIGIGIGGIVNGYLSSKIKRNKPILFFGNIGSLFCVLLIIYFHHSIFILMLLHIAFGFFSSSMLLCFSIPCKSLSKHMHGSIIGFLNTVIITGSVLFQPLSGYLLSNDYFFGNELNEIKFQTVFIILPICLIASFIIQYFIKEKSQNII